VGDEEGEEAELDEAELVEEEEEEDLTEEESSTSLSSSTSAKEKTNVRSSKSGKTVAIQVMGVEWWAWQDE